MQPTRPAVLAAFAIVAAAAAALLALLGYGSLPPLPRSWPVTLAALGVIELVAARNVRTRLDGLSRTTPISPLVVVRWAALARAGSTAAALLVGGYLGFGGVLLRSIGRPAYNRDVLTCVLGLLAALLLLAAALRLERACRARRPPEPPQLGSRA